MRSLKIMGLALVVMFAMAASAMAGNMSSMKRIYIEKALPQSSQIRKSLQQVSTFLREQAAFKAAGLSSFFQSHTDPQGGEDSRYKGRISGISEIQEYFSKHPEASPDDCLAAIGKKKDEGGPPEGE